MLALKKVEVSGKHIEFSPGSAIYLVGNGGSASACGHIAVDMVKRGHHAVALTDPYVMSMFANDEGWENVFSKQLRRHAGGNDILVAISSSGESRNILSAAYVADQLSMRIITLSGFAPDNPLRTMGDVNYYVPSKNYGIVEITHLAILHSIVNPGVWP